MTRLPVSHDPRRGRILGRLALLVVALLGAMPGAPACADDAPGPAETIRLVRGVLEGVVPVEWRGGAGGRAERRHALVVGADGWLLLAGPPPPAGGTLVAWFAQGRTATPAEVWASDPPSALTLLRVQVEHLVAPALHPGDLSGGVPARLPAGTWVAMVTSDGAVARGRMRANHRRRAIPDPSRGLAVELTCLDEAALAAVPSDLGAPWVDRQGRVVGLLVGADVHVPDAGAEGSGLRPEVTTAYAVPAAVLREVWPLLRWRRRVDRAALGVRTHPVSDAIAAHVCRGCGGHVVEATAEDGPAARAGLLPMDILNAIDGAPLARGAVLGDALLPFRPGDTIRLGLLREGVALEIRLVLGSAAE
jgi:serine protease Do